MRGRKTLIASAGVPRKRQPIEPGPRLVRISCLLEADLAVQVDEVADEMTASQPDRRPATRTEALRALVIGGLQARGKGRRKR